MIRRHRMNQKSKSFRRIASNQVITPEGKSLTLQVIELTEGGVTKLYPLHQEQPFTEWMQGQIELKRNPDGSVNAYYQGKPIN
jgi:hypothetical protein